MRSRARAGLGIALFFSMLAVTFGAVAPSAVADYQTASTTTSEAKADSPVVMEGTEPAVRVTVKSVKTPKGVVHFVVINKATGAQRAEQAVDVEPGEEAGTSVATYTFPKDTPALATYEVQATFFPAPGSGTTGSGASPIYVTVLPKAPSL